MGTRITIQDLERSVDRLNELTGNPLTTWNRVDGRNIASIGNYTLSGAYGGYELHQIMNKGGGVDTPLNTGHVPKKQLYFAIRNFIKGIELAKNRV